MDSSRAVFMILLVCSSVSCLVQTSCGLVAGVESDSMTSYFGVPFAEPPVGKLRWQPPQPLTKRSEFEGRCWSEPILDASGPTPICIQYYPEPPYSGVIGTEDCLYLNLFVPKSPSADGTHPVLLWLYGGGLLTGMISQSAESLQILYGSPMTFTREGFIVVAINYRLGVPGFLTLPELSGNDFRGKNVSGNYGLLDAIRALQWIHDEIGHFGGDPNRVTVFGQSTGGTLVQSIAISPLARGLFHGAISMSAAPRLDSTMHDAYEMHYDDIISNSACASSHRGPDLLSCLYRANISLLVEILGKNPHYNLLDFFNIPDPSCPVFHPLLVSDGSDLLPSSFFSAFETGNFNWKNGEVLVFGTMREEIDFLPGVWFESNATREKYEGVVRQHFDGFGKGVSEAVLGAFPFELFHSAQQGYDQIGSSVSTCQNVMGLAAMGAKWAPEQVFVYLGTQRPEIPLPGFLVPSQVIRYAFHAFDAVAAFNNSPAMIPAFHSEDVEFGELIRNLFVQVLGEKKKKKSDEVVSWVPFGSEGMTLILETQNPRCVAHVMRDKCAYWMAHQDLFRRFQWIN